MFNSNHTNDPFPKKHFHLKLKRQSFNLVKRFKFYVEEKFILYGSIKGKYEAVQREFRNNYADSIV